MATNGAVRRYRTWYAVLLRLYPRSFHERFGEGMAQTFYDLCRERSTTERGLFGFAVWIFFETLVGIVMENIIRMDQLPLGGASRASESKRATTTGAHPKRRNAESFRMGAPRWYDQGLSALQA